MRLVSIKLVIEISSKLLFRKLVLMGYRFSTQFQHELGVRPHQQAIVVFPHTNKQFSDTSLVSYNSTGF